MTTNTDPVRALIEKWRGTHGSGFTSQGEFQAHLSTLRTCADELEAALAQQPAAPSVEAVGDWVLVPRQPTLDMANAAWRDLESQGIDPESVEAPQVWGAMLAAAPQQPAGVDWASAEKTIADALRSTGLVTNSDKWRAAEAVIAALAQQQGGAR